VKSTKKPWTDPDDAPEWSNDVFERAEVRRDGKVVRPAAGTLTKRGRPKLENPKRQVTLRLDGDLLDRLRDSGPGWQSRVNEILRKAVGR
jgi:uncharacterized protein (DUF4415 family)